MQGTAAAIVFSSALLATSAMAQSPDALRQQLFEQYCAGKTAKQSEDALAASGRFEAPSVFEAAGARFKTFRLKGERRAGVSVVTGSGDGLQCSAGVNNIGINLFENGRITKG